MLVLGYKRTQSFHWGCIVTLPRSNYGCDPLFRDPRSSVPASGWEITALLKVLGPTTSEDPDLAGQYDYDLDITAGPSATLTWPVPRNTEEYADLVGTIFFVDGAGNRIPFPDEDNLALRGFFS